MALTLGTAVAAEETVDFESDPAGTVLSSLGPVAVLGTNPNFAPGTNAAVVFDSSNPTGGDDDLGSPNDQCPGGGPGNGLGGEPGAPYPNCTALGHVLIVAENLVDANNDDLIDSPDDVDVVGAKLEFDFSAIAPVTLHRITILDVEADEPQATVELYGAAANLLATFNLPQVGDNGSAVVGLGPTPGVHRMVVTLNGSGAIDAIVYEAPLCGDGNLDPGEECDDGNNLDGDGCSATCQTEDMGGQGCTPGYWKQPHHFGSWVGYVPGDLFDAVFGVDGSGNPTLLEALEDGGGGEIAMKRHAVAALLNSAHGGVNYMYSTAQVIALVQHAYATGDFEGVKNLLAGQNELSCPLGRSEASIEERRRARPSAQREARLHDRPQGP